MSPAGLLWWLWPLMGLGQLVLLRRNMQRFGRPQPPAAGLPRVDVLIPARDEEAVIGASVAAALAQAGVDLRVRVGDDASQDATAARAREAAAGDARFDLVTIPALPAGWAGKVHACHVLAEGSDAAWLVFVDADTRLGPGALAAIAGADADMVSFWPRQEMGGFVERAMMPLLAFVLLVHLPFGLAEDTPDPRIAAANGQCLGVRRELYARLGGHAAVRDAIVDDLALARAAKAAGARLIVRDAGTGASCRMYRDGASLWSGFRKNLYPAFGGAPGPFFGGWSIWVAFQVLPLVGLVAGVGTHTPMLAGAAALQLGLGWVLRAVLAAHLGHPRWSIVWHPLAAIALALLMLDSARAWAGAGVTWKGRLYGAGEARGVRA